MSPEPERNSESSSKKNSLPFEPNKKRQTAAKSTKKQAPASKKTVEQSRKKTLTKEETTIPKVVSQRMVRRVAIFCGIPTFLGIGTLVGSYLLLTYADVELPPLAVLLVNLGFFGLGVLGITYGVLSASWDENRAGGLLGLSEFSTNFGRMVQGWRESRQNKV